MQQTLNALDPDLQKADIADGGAFGLCLHDSINQYKAHLVEIDKFWTNILENHL